MDITDVVFDAGPMPIPYAAFASAAGGWQGKVLLGSSRSQPSLRIAVKCFVANTCRAWFDNYAVPQTDTQVMEVWAAECARLDKLQSHPATRDCVVAFFGSGEIPDFGRVVGGLEGRRGWYVLMEAMDELPDDRLVRVLLRNLIAMAEALAALHAAGFCHLDVHAGNFMLSGTRAKLVDMANLKSRCQKGENKDVRDFGGRVLLPLPGPSEYSSQGAVHAHRALAALAARCTTAPDDETLPLTAADIVAALHDIRRLFTQGPGDFVFLGVGDAWLLPAPDGALSWAAALSPTLAHLWHHLPIGQGCFRLCPAFNATGACLAVTEDGVLALTGGGSMWHLNAPGQLSLAGVTLSVQSPRVVVSHATSSIVLDVCGGQSETVQGTSVLLYTRHGGENQSWTMIPAAGHPEYFHLCSSLGRLSPPLVLDTGVCASATGYAVGAPVAWPLHGGATQRWKVVHVPQAGPGVYRIYSAGGLVLAGVPPTDAESDALDLKLCLPDSLLVLHPDATFFNFGFCDVQAVAARELSQMS